MRTDMDGASTTLSSGSLPPPGGSWHRMALEFSGTTITAEYDGEVIGSVSDSHYPVGQAGFGVNGWSAAQFDNLRIEPSTSRSSHSGRR